MKRENNIVARYENFIHTKHGYCFYYLGPSTLAIIYNLYIRRQYRRKGYARQLIRLVIGEIREAGYTGVIEVEVKPKSRNIQVAELKRFYEQMGLVVREPSIPHKGKKHE